MNNKVIIEIMVVVILIVAFLVGGIFWLNNKEEKKAIQISDKTTSSLVFSDYGFNFSVPAGWYIWEGNSAASDLMYKTDFRSILESGPIGLIGLTNQKAKEYQKFMDNWKAESSETIVFIDSKTIDYKDRSFSNAGKIMSRLIDSEDTLKQREITMSVSSSEVNLKNESVDDKRGESGIIKINDKNARFFLVKNRELVDLIIIKMPIISDEKISSLVFLEYIRKNDLNGLDKLVSFIVSLNISSN